MNRTKMILFLLIAQLALTSCTASNNSISNENSSGSSNQQQSEDDYLLTQEVENTLATLQWETTSYLISVESVGTPYLSSDDTGSLVMVPVQVTNKDGVPRDICLSVTISANLPSYNASKVRWSSTYSQADYCGTVVDANSTTEFPVAITMVRRFNNTDETNTDSAQPSPREVDSLDDATYNQFCVTITTIDGNNVNIPVWKEHDSDSCDE